MLPKDTTKKITRIFFSFLFVFLVSFFVLPIGDALAQTSCGDGIIQTPNDDGADEECDGGAMNGTTCNIMGFDAGTLSCDAGCLFDTSSCCTRSNPTLSWVSTATQDAIEGEEITYELQIENNNSGGCTADQNEFYVFINNLVPAAEFNISGITTPISVAEGDTDSFTFKIKSSVDGDMDGTPLSIVNYTFNVEIKDGYDQGFSDTSTNGGYNITELECSEKPPELTLSDDAGDSANQGAGLDYNFKIKNNNSTNASCPGLPARTFEIQIDLPTSMRSCPTDWKHDFCDPANPDPNPNAGRCLDYSTIPDDYHYTFSLGSQDNVDKNFTLKSCTSAPYNTYPITIKVINNDVAGISATATEQYIVSGSSVEDCTTPADDDNDGKTNCADEDCIGDPACCGTGSWEIGVETCDSSDATDTGCLASEACIGCASCVNLFMEGGCPVNYEDCDCNNLTNGATGANGCETNLLTNKDNCGSCGNVCPFGCADGECIAPTGGLVPCGRMADNPDTVWNEVSPCNICHTIPLMNNITDYLVGLVGLISVLFIIIAGIISATSMGNTSTLGLAKTAVSKSLYGFAFVLVAWVIVNTGMVVFGFDDPLGDGNWAKIDCEVDTVPEDVSFCGDGIVQETGNGDGVIERCERRESKISFISRAHSECIDGDGSCPIGCYGSIDNDCAGLSQEAAWVNSAFSCDPETCDVGCTGDTTLVPVFDDIGLGCYLDDGDLATADCQKGKYVCDENTDTVECRDTFSDADFKVAGFSCTPEFDYCCAGQYSAFTALSFDVVRGTPGVFECDDVCKDLGKVCVGVGLRNPGSAACVYTVHNAGNCQNLVNLATTNCKSSFRLGSGFCNDTSGAPLLGAWSMGAGDTDCYCR